jgi:hypothetical protein
MREAFFTWLGIHARSDGRSPAGPDRGQALSIYSSFQPRPGSEGTAAVDT